MASLRPSLTEDFEDKGFVVLHRLFSAPEAYALRREIDRLRFDANRPAGADPLFDLWEGATRTRELWPSILHSGLIRTLREVVGDDVCYAYNSEVHANNAGYLWHRDCLDQVRSAGPDWDDTAEPYRLVRACIYLQSYEESGFELGVVPGSHRFGVRTLDGLVVDSMLALMSRLRCQPRNWDPRRRELPRLTTDESWRGRLTATTPTWIRVSPGDCVIIHQRLMHSASTIHGPQYAIYLSYGPPDRHTRRLWRHHRYDRPDRPFSAPPTELARQLAQANLLLDFSTREHDPRP